MPLSAAEKQKRYRERLKTDREKYEKAKQKQRERYHKTKRLVKDLTPKERYNANVIWKLRKRQLKARKKAAEGLLQQTPPDSPTFDLNTFTRSSKYIRCSPRLIPRSGKEIPRNAPVTNTTPTTTPVASPQATPPLTPRIRSCDSSPSGTPKNRRKNKVKRDRARVHRENQILKQNIKKLKQKYDKYKKRFEREKKKKALDTEKNEDLRYKVLSGAIKKTFKQTKSRKEREVIKKIFSTVEVIDSRMKKKMLMNNLGIDKIVKRKFCIENETVLKRRIKDFYLRDDVSRATAGKKETVTKAQVKVQKRFMLDSMKNLYKAFIKENPDLRCSYFYFTRNKPFYVVSASVDGRNTCLCKIHTNFAYKANVLKKKGITGTDNLNILIESTVCNVKSKNCMYGICDLCANKQYEYFRKNIRGTITWPEWIRKEDRYKKDEKLLKTIKNVKEYKNEEAEAFVKIFENDLKAFKIHVFNIKTQFQSFRHCLDNIRPYECILVADFSENYNCKHSQEVQSHHFGGSRKQISLHTVVVYTFNKNSAKGYEVNSFCTISESNNHQPAAIWCHLDPILKSIRSNFADINTVHFYSDGPSTQYRQKQNFYLMCTRFFDYGFVNMTWSFFEAGHGKGPADGIGGFLKRTADKIVANVLFDANKNELLPDLTNEDALPEALEAHMIDVMASDTLTLDLEIISDDDTPLASLKITKQLQELTNRRQNIYSKIYNSESDKSYSSDKEPSASYDINAKIGRGDFLLVKLYVDASKTKSYTYACKTLTEIEDDGEIQVMFLRVVDENAKRFRLDKKDISYVNHENIVKKLPVPALVKKGCRSYYVFKESLEVFEKI
ncbi:unnamed protein product [Diatraea saccharalis]|uniref:Uncharacterized protein n=1 Tax=Diatraea saccharalis TaxID=40085 RepID=A0A9N9WGC7_9NEOP|nr:unnamed protein product [Diatraea saccharalis]